VSERLKTLGKMTPEERQVMGPAINGLRDRVTEAITARKAELRDAAIDARLATETVDVTLPVRPAPAEPAASIRSPR
jgi:phenylalanyl-tRNA synthetase alpha chain